MSDTVFLGSIGDPTKISRERGKGISWTTKMDFAVGIYVALRKKSNKLGSVKKLVGTNVMIKRSFALLLGAKLKYHLASESPYSPNRTERTIMFNMCD